MSHAADSVLDDPRISLHLKAPSVCPHQPCHPPSVPAVPVEAEDEDEDEDHQSRRYGHGVGVSYGHGTAGGHPLVQSLVESSNQDHSRLSSGSSQQLNRSTKYVYI